MERLVNIVSALLNALCDVAIATYVNLKSRQMGSLAILPKVGHAN